ncbi:probable methyltransferase-like protein 25 isoform X2 [Adelges cooleyi]|uniref:probable methyltransferase-like protein 25 isoform X2 n=1 Tax=Adelges cooleyi TaxID=133065 RepID=UPI0021808AAB|nr:probable methyltransferase-like protein 25 isoform X2 [Adelges cooleyi]
MEQLRSKLEEVILFLKPYLPIANSHVVNFITNNLWDNVIPEEIKRDMSVKSSHVLFSNFWSANPSPDSLTRFVALAKCNNLESYPKFCYKKLDSVNTLLQNYGINSESDTYELKEFMAAKKMHEVEVMARVVGDFAKVVGTNIIVDIGGGKGYLSSLLALAHSLDVLGIDSQSINSEGAKKRTLKFEKYWMSICKKPTTTKTPCPIIKEKLNSNEEYYKKYRRKPIVVGSTYKQTTEYVTENTKIATLVQNEFTVDNNECFGLVGLHTCGSLATTCIKLFAEPQNRLNLLVNVGCCYHLIEEEFTVNSFWQDVEQALNEQESYGFPVSQFLKDKHFKLGRDARMCASQSPDKIFNLKDLAYPTKPLFYRSLLQVYLLQELSIDEVNRQHVGRLAHKCATFNEYVHKAVKRLKLNIKVDDEKVNNLYNSHLVDYEKLQVFFLLKQVLAPVIEGFILMDRLLYLYEQGFTEAFVAQLFDPLLSPRNHAIIALNKKT